MYSLHFFYF